MHLSYEPLGGAREVGASCGILQIGETRILVDAGMRPSARPDQSRTPDLNRLQEIPPAAILITHAHIDHSGCLPLVAGMVPNVPIYATESTIALMHILLADSVRIMAMEALDNELETPLYDAGMVEDLFRRITPIAFHAPFAPVPTAPITVEYLPAGHILGAGMLLFTTRAGTLLHTGDLSVGDHRTIKGVDVQQLPTADWMICEGTYGNRTHGSRKEQERHVVNTVQAAIDRGGKTLIPAFAVGRAQEIILILRAHRTAGALSPINIYVDGMCKAVCHAYETQSHDLLPRLQRNYQSSRRPIFLDERFHVYPVTPRERQRILTHNEPCVVISTSGMLSGGPAPLYAAAFAESERNSIIFTGYQDEESPGAALLRAHQGTTMTIGRTQRTLQCHIARYSLSAHADSLQIEQVIQMVNPQEIIFVHGDDAALTALSQRCSKRITHRPKNGDIVVFQTRHALHAQPIITIPQSHDLPEPTVPALYEAVTRHGAAVTRPWTSTELGRCLYGESYHPGLRAAIEAVLTTPYPFFKTRLLGRQTIYLPQPMIPLTTEPTSPPNQSKATKRGNPPTFALEAGMIVIAQSIGARGPSRLGLILETPKPNGNVRMVVYGWKGIDHQYGSVCVLPQPIIARPAWLALPIEEIRTHIHAWQTHLDSILIDLVTCWAAAQGQPQSIETLAAHWTTDDERLAGYLSLFQRGSVLWKRHTDQWIPRPLETLPNRDQVLRHHIFMAHAGDQITHRRGQSGILTGRVGWGVVEVCWNDGTTSVVKHREVVAEWLTPTDDSSSEPAAPAIDGAGTPE